MLACISVIVLWGETAIANSKAEAIYNQGIVKLEAGKKTAAMSLLLEASSLGFADAHYQLVHLSDQPDIKRYHLIEAASLEHKDAINYLFTEKYYQPSDIFFADPIEAWSLYSKHGGEISTFAGLFGEGYSGEREIRTLKSCYEAGPIELSGLLKQFGLHKIFLEKAHEPYAGWMLAEQAASGDITGVRNPRLALQIVCRSVAAPTERSLAVEALFDQWSRGAVADFNICSEFITSSFGVAFCKYR